MDAEHLRQNWALWAAAVLAAIAVVAVAAAMLRNSSGGRLRRDLRVLRTARRQRAAAIRARNAAAERVERLSARAASTKPRVLERAKGSLEDAEALEKIAQERVMRAVTTVRETIFAEFPPDKQPALRARHLGADDPER